MKRIRRFVNFLAFALLVASLVTELRKPAAERTWHGKLFDFVPYDFRPPTLARAQSTFWNPDNPSIVVPQLVGVGWTVNLYPLLHRLIGSDTERGH
ncbi:MAG TPA: DUF5808 domain-containing protein [Chloroflexota bacterium]|nr:DUF5808 domain-containing protein [Chloroflexota bacterium]